MPSHSALHGHSFRVEAALNGTPNPAFGWSRNLREAEPMIDAVWRELDRTVVRQGRPGASEACACSGKH